MNHKKVLLHKPKLLCCKLSGACQVYCCFKLACDVTDFEAYTYVVIEHFSSTLSNISQAFIEQYSGISEALFKHFSNNFMLARLLAKNTEGGTI
jgi:hypothetical protein